MSQDYSQRNPSYNPDIYTLKEASNYLEISREMLQMLVNRKEIDFSVRNGRCVFTASQLATWKRGNLRSRLEPPSDRDFTE